ncbi:MAG: F0F1 ATP synthase subunit epsilon [Desulfobacterales bacterium]|jgi:F-type H+-transporting ATPase subunit epsilon|nr:F0F1 ATP synthase subunit epsilon [Desulfobacteraceae bacterium]MBT7086757.1 F0F1 ATP synthase subunit epsilon [Desulfobacterales bacterium]MBT7697340.1 F0F1 ATP synthase subunit epsilon [Desulfobacterales bacterium]
MADKIKIEVVTPEKLVVSDDAEIVVAPGALGEFGALSGHTPFLSTLKTGTLRYVDSNGKERYVFISGGFAEVLPDKVSVLAESAERKSEIDIDRARTALERAEKRLQSDDKDIDINRAQSALERASYRLKLAEADG